jgi:hypothetical protein
MADCESAMDSPSGRMPQAAHRDRVWEIRGMTPISRVFELFLAETGPGSPESARSHATIIALVVENLNRNGYLVLDPFVRIHEGKPDIRKSFCDRYGLDCVRPLFLSALANEAVERSIAGDEAGLNAGKAVIASLMDWLVKRAYWDSATCADLQNPKLLGLTSQFSLRCSFDRLLHDYIKNHPVLPPKNTPEEDFYDGQFVIWSVEFGRLHLGYLGPMGPFDHVSFDWSYVDAAKPGSATAADVVLNLPQSITDKAVRGFTFDAKIARVGGEWRIVDLESGGDYSANVRRQTADEDGQHQQ